MGAAYGRGIVTNSLNQKVSQRQSLRVAASNSVFGDPWRGVRKTLVVVYQQGHCDPAIVTVREHQTLVLNSRYGCTQRNQANTNTLKIIGAAYGLADVTYHVQRMVRNNRLDVSASNGVFGDTYGGIRKSLVIVYQHGNGPYRTEVTTEGSAIHIR